MNKNYLKFLESVESALYPDESEFERDEWSDDSDPEWGLVYTYYKGAENRTYSQPMFEVKRDHVPKGENCYRCGDFDWRLEHDQVIGVRSIPGYIGDMPVHKPVTYNRVFAARRSHP